MRANGVPPIENMVKAYYPDVKIKVNRGMGDPSKKYLISADKYTNEKRVWIYE